MLEGESCLQQVVEAEFSLKVVVELDVHKLLEEEDEDFDESFRVLV